MSDGALTLACPRHAAVWIAVRPRADRLVRAQTIDFNEAAEFDLDAPSLGGPSSSMH
jgi:hypothetical protein